MHYTANGKPSADRSRIGLVFAQGAPKQESIIAALVNVNFTLPAGAQSTRVDAEMTMEQDMTVWSLLPHTHVRGRRWEIEATYPDGRTETLLAVPNYDFNWQTDYVFKEPLKLPKGTVLRSSAWYDNSAANKTNPDPKARRSLGRADLGRDAVHRVHVHARPAAVARDRDRRAATVSLETPGSTSVDCSCSSCSSAGPASGLFPSTQISDLVRTGVTQKG